MEKTHTLLHLDVFYRDILLIWGNEEQTRQVLAVFHDEDEINELMESINFTGGKGTTVYSASHNAFFVWLPELPKTAQEVGFLVHELFHVTYAVMENIGVSLSEDSEEAFAYTIGYLTEKIIEMLPTFSSCRKKLTRRLNCNE